MTTAPGNTIADQPISAAISDTSAAYLVIYDAAQSPATRRIALHSAIAEDPLAGVSFSGITFSGGTLSAPWVAPSAGMVYSNGTTIAAASLSTGLSYSAGTLTLGAATGAARGGVVVGSNITVSSGTISLTGANVNAALGLSSGVIYSNGTSLGTLTLGSSLTYSSGTLSTSGLLSAANNLSDVSSAGTARRNVSQGVGTLSTASATIAVSMTSNNAFVATLTSGVGPYTLDNPTGMAVGASGIISFVQPAAGSAQTLSYASNWKFMAPYSNAAPPALTASLSARDVLTWFSPDGTICLASLANNPS